jgi:hypothetical protein
MTNYLHLEFRAFRVVKRENLNATTKANVYRQRVCVTVPTIAAMLVMKSSVTLVVRRVTKSALLEAKINISRENITY